MSVPEDPAAAIPTVAGPPRPPTVWDQMGGPIGMLDSGLPVVVFVIVNALTTLPWAIAAALASGVLIAVGRLVRHKPVTQAIGGLFAVGIAAFIAHRTGSAKGYFLYGIWTYLVYLVALVISILIRWPLVGTIWEFLNGRGGSWRAKRDLVRRYDWATAVWVVVFAARLAVQKALYGADQVGWLAAARLAMGYPLYLLGLLATVLIVGSAAGMKLPDRLNRRRKLPADGPGQPGV